MFIRVKQKCKKEIANSFQMLIYLLKFISDNDVNSVLINI